MELDYKKIGARIKEIRLRKGIPQDKLAEYADLSVPHMSHIETANTKLSLPALVAIANALEVSIDELICDSITASKPTYSKEFSELISDCDINETRFLIALVKSAKAHLKENFKF